MTVSGVAEANVRETIILRIEAPMRELLKSLLRPLVRISGPSSRAAAPDPTASMDRLEPGSRATFGAFIRNLRENPTLRDGFAQNPRKALLEAGIDPGAFDLPARLDDAQIDRYLSSWSAILLLARNPAPPPPSEAGQGSTPPPAPRENRPSSPKPSEPPPVPPPPTPVYGSPPGLR
jgi:hypothetical protein